MLPGTGLKNAIKYLKNANQLLTSDVVLAHYDENLPLQVSCDASAVGLGAVLSQIVGGKQKAFAL